MADAYTTTRTKPTEDGRVSYTTVERTNSSGLIVEVQFPA